MMRFTQTIRVLVLPAVLLVACAMPVRARAQGGCISGQVGCTTVPEMDPALAGQGAALIAGAVFLLRARRKG
jgi:hypothetical protein